MAKKKHEEDMIELAELQAELTAAFLKQKEEEDAKKSTF